MIKYSSKKNKRISLGKIFFTLTGLLALIVVGHAFTKNYIANREIDKEIQNIEDKINQLQTENIKFEELIKYFDSQAYAELKARSELSMQKPGEAVVVITNDSLAREKMVIDSKDDAEEKEISNPKKWFRYFFIKQ